MTEKKHVAQTLMTLLINPLVMDILDRNISMEDIIPQVKEFWGYDLMSRKPGPAYDGNGIFQGTNLDLACFLYNLIERNTVINIPTYDSFSAPRLKEGQTILSKDNRNGELLAVIGNKSNFRFSVRIMDMNIVSADKVGDFRTFTLTDNDGTWYKGWNEIQFVPTINENKFITENQLWSGNRIIFTNFVHPNRWTSFFGHHYAITKLLIKRLTDERSYLNVLKKEMIADGITYPSGWATSPQSFPSGETKRLKVDSFEVQIDVPNNDSKFPEYEKSQESLVHLNKMWKNYGSTIESLKPDRMPSWLQNVEWEHGYKVPPRGRSEWDRLVLFQPGVGETGVSIRKRRFVKSETVSARYEPA